MSDHYLNGRPQLVDGSGRPIRSGQNSQARGVALPHGLTFVARYQGASKTYLHDRFDEALRHSRQDALAMRNDAYLMGLLQERMLAVAGLNWHLEVPDEREPRQKAVKDTLTRVVRGIPNFRRIMWWLLEAIWYGKYGAQVEYEWSAPPSGRKSSSDADTEKYAPKRVLTVADAWPVEGDKIGHHEDHCPYVLINAAATSELPDSEIVYTTRGTALSLRGTWRERFLIHKHLQEDADFFSPEQAEAVHGVGVRSKVYWTNFLKMEWLGNITDFYDRVGLGMTIWEYPRNNPEAKAAVERAAAEQSNRAHLFVPVDPDDTSRKAGSGVTRMEVPTSGADALGKLIELLDGYIERYVVGQEGSSRGSATGLGSDAGANMQADTKRAIQVQDAAFLAQTLTGSRREPGLISVLKANTFPWADFPVTWQFDVERTESEAKLRSAKAIVDMGLSIKAEEVLAAGGFSKPLEGDDVVEGKQPEPPPGVPGGGPPGADGGAPGDLMAGLMGGRGDESTAEDPNAAPPESRQKPRPQQVTRPKPAPPNRFVEDDASAFRFDFARAGTPIRYAGKWESFEGPRGGKGWRNTQTGRVEYGDEPPGGREGGGEADDEDGPERVPNLGWRSPDEVVPDLQEISRPTRERSWALAASLEGDFAEYASGELTRGQFLGSAGAKVTKAWDDASRSLIAQFGPEVKQDSNYRRFREAAHRTQTALHEFAKGARKIDHRYVGADLAIAARDVYASRAGKARAESRADSFDTGETDAEVASRFPEPSEPRRTPEKAPDADALRERCLTRKLSSGEQKAIASYTDRGYRALNRMLRDGMDEEEIPDAALALHERLRGVFARLKPLPEPVTAYRGLSLDANELDGLLSHLESAYMAGKPVGLAGYSSTSLDPAVADLYADGGKDARPGDSARSTVLFEISAVKGLPLGEELSRPDPVTGERSEAELLLDHDSTFDVAGIRRLKVVGADGTESERLVVQLAQRGDGKTATKDRLPADEAIRSDALRERVGGWHDLTGKQAKAAKAAGHLKDMAEDWGEVLGEKRGRVLETDDGGFYATSDGKTWVRSGTVDDALTEAGVPFTTTDKYWDEDVTEADHDNGVMRVVDSEGPYYVPKTDFDAFMSDHDDDVLPGTTSMRRMILDHIGNGGGDGDNLDGGLYHRIYDGEEEGDLG